MLKISRHNGVNCFNSIENLFKNKGEYIMPPFTNICKYKDRCPSATGWCFNKQPDKDCLFYLNTHLHSVNRDLNNTIELIEIIKRKESDT